MGGSLTLCSGDKNISRGAHKSNSPPSHGDDDYVQCKNVPAIQLFIYEENLSPELIKYEIQEEDLEICEDVLCRPTFGNRVRVASARNIFFNKIPVPVIVKSCSPVSVGSRASLLQELRVLSSIQSHENIVTFLGVVVEQSRIEGGRGFSIVLEFCSNRNLLQFLRDHRAEFSNQLSESDYANIGSSSDLSPPFPPIYAKASLLQWSSQIASGMHFLRTKRVIFADLSCSNILLTDKFTAKIGGFSLARILSSDEQSYTLTEPTPLPWRCLAIESLKYLRFSMESDVWAFGIVLWEIFSLGETPYAGFIWSPTFADNIMDGLRPHPPKFATTPIYNLMLNCWFEDPATRPTFFEVIKFFNELSSIEAPE